MHRISILIISFLLLAFSGWGQGPQVLDKIIGVVGNKVILQSELDLHLEMEKNGKPNVVINDSLKCEKFADMLAEKILVEQAVRDSVIISEEELEDELQNRLRMYIMQFGSEEQLEKTFGKSIYQLKEENRTIVRDQLTANRVQEKVMSNVKITPQEVRAFFDALKQDEIPPIPARLELGQIVIEPKIDAEVDAYAKEQLEKIRKDIVEGGRDFAMMAGLYSQDDGTKNNGGLIKISRSGFDPAFISAAYRLQNGEISPVFKSSFGYHIVKMEQRKGDEAMVRHILIMPEITKSDIALTLEKMDTIYQQLINKNITFQAAVAKYSNDEESKLTGGVVYIRQQSSLDINLLDKEMALIVNELKVGSFSKPHQFIDNRNKKSCRILFLRSRTEPHQANMDEDYDLIQNFALMEKKEKYMHEYIGTIIPTFYIKIDPAYQGCDNIKQWTIQIH